MPKKSLAAYKTNAFLQVS